ncbi:MAG: hypothetical protein ACRERE_37800 [Candidatus Entotheonellia bacterium]
MVDADIEADCGTSDHEVRMSLVPRRRSDRRGLKRLRQGRHVGGLEDGRWPATARGGPPGGVISPL